MEMTIEYQNGIYTGEVKDGLPHGNGILKISDSKTFEGYWQEGKRKGAGVIPATNPESPFKMDFQII